MGAARNQGVRDRTNNSRSVALRDSRAALSAIARRFATAGSTRHGACYLVWALAKRIHLQIRWLRGFVPTRDIGLMACQLIPSSRMLSCFCGRRYVRSRTRERANADGQTCERGQKFVRSRTAYRAKLLESGESFCRLASLTSVTLYNISNAAWRRGDLDMN